MATVGYRGAGFPKMMQQRVAEVAVGPSTVRNQGATGVAGAARTFRSRLAPGRFGTRRASGFRSALDRATEDLRRSLPRGARHWGLARNVLNLFLRDAHYNRVLCGVHGLGSSAEWMEVPLDRMVAEGLVPRDSDRVLPGRPGVKHLSPAVSDAYQRLARREAGLHRIHTVDMDLLSWRSESAPKPVPRGRRAGRSS